MVSEACSRNVTSSARSRLLSRFCKTSRVARLATIIVPMIRAFCGVVMRMALVGYGFAKGTRPGTSSGKLQRCAPAVMFLRCIAIGSMAETDRVGERVRGGGIEGPHLYLCQRRLASSVPKAIKPLECSPFFAH